MHHTGALPVRGTLPDMAASSDRFVELQRCFSEQARADAAAVRAHALRLFKELGRVRSFISVKFC